MVIRIAVVNVSVAEAKAKFSELLKRAEAGEEVAVTRHGKVVARLVPPTAVPKKPPLLGALKGKIWIADDFDEPLEEFEEYRE
jgi:prevent-host-death family protein